MNRLQPELDRLYGLNRDAVVRPALENPGGAPVPGDLRVAVLELAQPAGWAQLSSVWQGVQSELELPAPAIAVSGVDGLQLWFSFASPVSSSVRLCFLEALRDRYLAAVAPKQLRLFAGESAIPAEPTGEVRPQRWSAFVTSDLASIFAETPWLDIAPGDEGQATILRALTPMGSVAFQAAFDRLATGREARSQPVVGVPTFALPLGAPVGPAGAPATFLTTVMNDTEAPLSLRIEAARILLSHPGHTPSGSGTTT